MLNSNKNYKTYRNKQKMPRNYTKNLEVFVAGGKRKCEQMKKHELLDEETYYYKDIHCLQINPQIKMSILSTYLPIYLWTR